MSEQDRKLSDLMKREGDRLRNFIRRRVADTSDAEDILQDVFYELLEAVRLTKPIEQISAWMFRVARNRIVDLFRKKRPQSLSAPASVEGASESATLEDLLPSPDAGPEAMYTRSVLLDVLDTALEELPTEQRDVFLAHEVEGQSFQDISAETGVSVNTLLSRKHYAVAALRKRLRDIIDEFERQEEL